MTNTLIPAGQDAPRIPRTLSQVRAAGPVARLRAVLMANAATSAVVGLLGLVGAHFWATELGLDDVAAIRIVSASLLVFAIAVALVASQSTHALGHGAAATSAVDGAWVAATVVVIANTDLTTLGTVIAIALGVGVADFAVTQLWLRSRLP
jgi:hypothetical protein